MHSVGYFRCGGLVWLALAAAPLVGAGQARPPAAQAAAEATRLFQQGSAAFNAGDFRSAQAAFSRLVRLVPRAAAAHSALGATLLAEGEARSALPELQVATELDPGDVPSGVHLGMAYRALHDEAKAVAAFRRAAGLPGAVLTPEETAAYASALAGTGDLASAETVLEAALPAAAGGAANGSRAVVLDTLGAVLAQRSQMAPARQRFEQAIAADANLASAHAHLGSIMLASGDPQGALEQLQTAVRLGDSSPGTQVESSRALLATGHDSEAVAAAREALKGAPQLFEGRYALALALQANGQPTEALPLFAALTAERPKDPELLVNYGLALVQTGDAKKAVPLYERALAEGGPLSTLREDLGTAYLQQNDTDQAIEQFRLGLQDDAENVQLHYDLGLAYKLKDDTAGATAELRHVEELDPKLPDAPYTLGVLEMQQGHFPEAGEQLRRAVTLQPGNGEAWSLLGSVYQQAHEPEKAADALRRAIQLLPAQPSPHVTLAAVLAEQGDRPGAAAERKIAADLSRAAVGHQRAQFALDSGRALLRQGKLQEALVQLRTAVQAEPEAPEAHLALAEALQRSGQVAEARSERERAAALAASASPPAGAPR